MTGCSPPPEPPAPGPNPPGTFETADTPDVTVAFAGALVGTARYSDGVRGIVHNTTRDPKRVRVTLVSHGLDARALTAIVGTFALRAGQDRTFRVPFSRFFVQCSRAECEHELYAQLVASDEARDGDGDGDKAEDEDDDGARPMAARRDPARTPLIPSMPLYARFSADFRRVELYGTFGQDGVLGPSATVRTFDGFLAAIEPLWRPLDVPAGRTFDGKRFVPVSPATQRRDDAAVYGESLALHGERARQYQDLVPRRPIEPRGGGPTYAICSTWKQVFIDSDWPVFGQTEDLFLNETLGEAPARFASGVLVSSSRQIFWAGTLDGAGCVGGLKLSADAYWFYQDTRLDDGRRKFDIQSGMPQIAGGIALWNGVHVSQFTVTGNGGLVTLHPNDHSSLTRVAAVMGQVLVTPDNGLNAGGFVYKVLAEQGCFPTQNVYCSNFTTQRCYQACYDPMSQTLLVGPNQGNAPPDSAYKYVITHELGHHVQSTRFGDQYWQWGKDQNGNDSPQFGVSSPICRCDHVDSANQLHCLQSDEEQGSGSHEGFAHFFASRIWNDRSGYGGIFTYYKHFLQPMPNLPPVNVPPPFARIASGVLHWLDVRCGAEPQVGRGVEWDWLMFYYDVNTGAAADRTPLGGAPPNLGTIYERACGTPGTPCKSQKVPYASLLGSAAVEFGGNDPRFIRFRDTGNTHGINH